ncbi:MULTISPECIES: RNA polymerase sigma factor [Limnobacter]|nr:MULTISPECIES: sigma-70 family RNA polymerase sigma factor [Limnobacter]HEX5486717.1 sigma-70 family RNA polymerase sigma factor [Limnobacter sp.]
MTQAQPKLKITSVKRCAQTASTSMRSDFELLMAKQEKRLKNFITKHFRDESAVEDLFQQTLIEAYCSWDNFRGDSKRETWLFGIALNIIRNVARRSPQYRFNFTTDESLELEQAEGADPIQICMKNEFSVSLDTAIDKLPTDLKDTLMLVVKHGNSYQEAADLLGIPIGTVRSRISRSRAQLKFIYDMHME